MAEVDVIERWTPLRKGEASEMFIALCKRGGEDVDTKVFQVWSNDVYEIVVRIYPPEGFTHLSVKRYDRESIHDWRHLQQIKNEICGYEREAVEIYPAEARIVDTANEYHLWVLPEGQYVPFAFRTQHLMSAEANAEFNSKVTVPGGGKGKQRPWQPGLTTGLGEGVEDLVRLVHRLDDASGGSHAEDAMTLIAHLRGSSTASAVLLAHEVLEEAELVDDDGMYGYVIGPALIDKLKGVVDAGT